MPTLPPQPEPAWQFVPPTIPARVVAFDTLEALLAEAAVGLDLCSRPEPKDRRPICTDSQRVAAAWASFAVICRTLEGLLGRE